MSVNNLRPLEDRIIIKRHEIETVTPGGILLPESVQKQEKPCRGTVVAVGPGKFYPELLRPGVDPVIAGNMRLAPPVDVGDVVVFTRYGGYEVPDSDDLLILRADDILAVEDAAA